MGLTPPFIRLSVTDWMRQTNSQQKKESVMNITRSLDLAKKVFQVHTVDKKRKFPFISRTETREDDRILSKISTLLDRDGSLR